MDISCSPPQPLPIWLAYLNLSGPSVTSRRVSWTRGFLISASTWLQMHSQIPGTISRSQSMRRLGLEFTSNNMGFPSSNSNTSKPRICNSLCMVNQFIIMQRMLNLLTFCFICWFGNVSQKYENNLQCVVNISSKVTVLSSKFKNYTLIW